MRKGGKQGILQNRAEYCVHVAAQHLQPVFWQVRCAREMKKLTAQAPAPRASALQDSDTHLVSCAMCRLFKVNDEPEMSPDP